MQLIAKSTFIGTEGHIRRGQKFTPANPDRAKRLIETGRAVKVEEKQGPAEQLEDKQGPAEKVENKAKPRRKTAARSRGTK